jgi:P-type E1-E2 ATPase
MLTGDRKQVAKAIASQVGITDVHAESLPADKLKVLHEHKDHNELIAMVGDGVNDAPTLAAADVGIALGAKGSTAASESADVVIMLDDLSRVADAVVISKHALKIAKQSIFVGMGLSFVLMVLALMGKIPPLYGALLQQYFKFGRFAPLVINGFAIVLHIAKVAAVFVAHHHIRMFV